MIELNNKARICVLTAGGEVTEISAAEEQGVNRPVHEDPIKLEPKILETASVDVLRLMELERLALNMGTIHFKTVAERIRERLSDYDGFLVTAPRDIISFLAPYLAFSFGPTLDKTISVTGSNQTARSSWGDARLNIARGVLTAGLPYNEVVINFDDQIVRATSHRVKVVAPKIFRFESFQEDEALGLITGEVEQSYQRSIMEGPLNFRPYMAERVISLSMIPGIEPEFIIEPALQSNGVILYSEGKGTVPNEGNMSMIPVIETLSKNKVPVLVVSTMPGDLIAEGSSSYSSTTQAEGAGAIVVNNMWHSVATTKFRWVISLVEDRVATGEISKDQKCELIREMMLLPYVGEFALRSPFTDPIFN
jgi:L-asparaginase/Glu-tRNA(Gln) amidotransferase subunit D